MPELTTEMFVVSNKNDCKVGAFLAGLSPKSRAVLEEALNADKDTAMSAAGIADRLRDAGYEDPPKETSIRRHRRGGCACRN